jgi:hypothetical protein
MYYLGLEAHLKKDNRFASLEEAVSIAEYAAKTLNKPIRIFYMQPDFMSKLAAVVDQTGHKKYLKLEMQKAFQ